MVKLIIVSLSMQRFWATDGHWKCTVFLFCLSSHYHIRIFKSLCASRDNCFENLGETLDLACKMFTSGCRPWLKNVACLSSLRDAVTRHASYWEQSWTYLCLPVRGSKKYDGPQGTPCKQRRCAANNKDWCAANKREHCSFTMRNLNAYFQICAHILSFIPAILH